MRIVVQWKYLVWVWVHFLLAVRSYRSHAVRVQGYGKKEFLRHFNSAYVLLVSFIWRFFSARAFRFCISSIIAYVFVIFLGFFSFTPIFIIVLSRMYFIVQFFLMSLVRSRITLNTFTMVTLCTTPIAHFFMLKEDCRSFSKFEKRCVRLLWGLLRPTVFAKGTILVVSMSTMAPCLFGWVFCF